MFNKIIIRIRRNVKENPYLYNGVLFKNELKPFNYYDTGFKSINLALLSNNPIKNQRITSPGKAPFSFEKP